MRVVDVSALGPGPFCSMLLADYGADVLAVERPRQASPGPEDVADQFSRGKRTVTIDLRAPNGPEAIRSLTRGADVFLEGYRPGTMERRGLGPAVLMADNPRLVYTRLTGWGQSGPYAQRAGHDIAYIAIGGLLGVIGRDRPTPPLNLMGDFASGSLMAAMGTLLALFERERTGVGQVVDAAMVDGAALLLSAQLAEFSTGIWSGRGKGILSGSAPFYGVYLCADNMWLAVGAIESKFYAELLDGLGLTRDLLAGQHDRRTWPALREEIGAIIASRPRAHWEQVFQGSDACTFPVLEITELAQDPHLQARGTIVTEGTETRAAPAPRLSETPAVAGSRLGRSPEVTWSALVNFGMSEAELERYVEDGTICLDPDQGADGLTGTPVAREPRSAPVR